MPHSNETVNMSVFLEKLGTGVLVIGRDDGIIRYVNQRVCRSLGKTVEELVEENYRKVFWPEYIAVYDRLQADCDDGKEHRLIYYWPEMRTWEQHCARTIQWDKTPCILMSVMNVSEIAQSEYKFEDLAYFDNLLKLPNATKLEEDIDALPDPETVAMISLGIEQFEDINDLYGWENGDNLLKQIRDWLIASESRWAQLYRVKDGFVILGCKVGIEEAKQRAGEILRRFTKPWFVSAGGNGLMLYCRVRLGIVHGNYLKSEIRGMIQRTIHAEDENTSSGYYIIYDEQADRRAKRAVMLRDTLINCIFDDMKGFDVHYQPIVDVRTESWSAVEALCRWTTPQGERIPPDEFIGIAEQLGLINDVDSWVRRTAMAECVALGLDRNRFSLDVNFSPTQKVNGPLIEDIMRTLERTKFPPEKLTLEITESAKMLFDEDNLNGLKQLKWRGIVLSLDDFGTGYSSFANLIKLSADELKTDKLFLDEIENNDYRQYLLRTLVDIGHYLGMHIVAEGVETREQFELLKKYGVDYVQGYLYSKPLPYEELVRHLDRFR